ncbi:hypothetical protein OSB04_028941 [Centaurea solstitialis]|uniref:Uncharacterized protein n=1 Tax=Centaurea solstitialis TaxID=347529 RepID=A0AA38W889_9ASTR|nr:hypothetical protein OSB04_028941 [Centaurea solstitialis]
MVHHFQEVKRILRHVKGTLDFGLTFSKPSKTSIIGFSDADSARCLVLLIPNVSDRVVVLLDMCYRLGLFTKPLPGLPYRMNTLKILLNKSNDKDMKSYLVGFLSAQSFWFLRMVATSPRTNAGVKGVGSIPPFLGYRHAEDITLAINAKIELSLTSLHYP